MRWLKRSVCIVAVGVGCGGDSKVDVAAYRALATEISAAVEVHRATSQSMAPAGCPAEATRYGSEVRPRLDRMSSMSADVDECMGGTGGGATLSTSCASMRQELEGHLSGACAGADIAGEATRHASAMQEIIDHELRATSMMGGSMSGGHCFR